MISISEKEMEFLKSEIQIKKEIISNYGKRNLRK